MPTYTPPVMDPIYEVWRAPNLPSTHAPTFTGFSLQMYVYGREPNLLLHGPSGRWLPLIIFRMPRFSSVLLRPDDIISHPTDHPLEVKGYWKIQYVQKLHYPFANQYWALYTFQCNPNGTIPRLPVPT